jgi:hypothetical protein
MLSRISVLGKGRVGILRVLLPVLLLAGFMTGGRIHQPPSRWKDTGCRADVSFPLDLRVVPTSPVRPGALVTARIEVTSRLLLDDVRIRIVPPADIRVLSTPAASLGLLRAGEARSETLSLIAPPGTARRTVEIVVEGSVDGVPITRGAILNLALEDEPSRIVTTPDGRRIREVPARRIG